MNTEPTTAGLGQAPVPPNGPSPDNLPDPAARLLAQAGSLRVKATGRDALLLKVGAAMMVAGPLVAIIGYAMSSQAKNEMYQNDAIVVAIIGLTVAVVGAGLFLRYSLTEFLRFWMARMIFQQQRAAEGSANQTVDLTSPPRQPAKPPMADLRTGERML
jgi:hypothetical protein